MDFGFDKAEKHAIFHPYAPEALRLDEAVLKKNLKKLRNRFDKMEKHAKLHSHCA